MVHTHTCKLNIYTHEIKNTDTKVHKLMHTQIYMFSALSLLFCFGVLKQGLNIDIPGWSLIQSNPLASASQSAGPEQLNLTLHRFE